jgi:hypothetical protein
MNIFESLEDAMRIYHLQQTDFFQDLERSVQSIQGANSNS